MTLMKTMMFVLMTILFGSLFISQSSHAEIYKWVDEKGSVHFTEDPATIPDKYRERAESRTTDEDSMSLEERVRAKKLEEEEIRERLRREKNESEIKGLDEQLRQKQKELGESETASPSVPSSGYIPFEKFKYLQEGMTEAEVLSRFGEPTRIVEDEARVSGGAVSGNVSPGGALSGTISPRNIQVIKRYYYIGDKNKGEKTTIIHFRKGKVMKYERI